MDIKKLWPTLIPIVGVVISAFSDVITAFFAGHPSVSLLVMTVITAVANLVKSPTQKS